MSSNLNYEQERELYRLLAYESRTCSRNGVLLHHCAFPFRPADLIQQDLIRKSMLAQVNDPQRGTIVVITSDGYSYFPELEQAEQREYERRRHERGLVIRTAVFCIICLVVGFLLGYLLH